MQADDYLAQAAREVREEGLREEQNREERADLARVCERMIRRFIDQRAATGDRGPWEISRSSAFDMVSRPDGYGGLTYANVPKDIVHRLNSNGTFSVRVGAAYASHNLSDGDARSLGRRVRLHEVDYLTYWDWLDFKVGQPTQRDPYVQREPHAVQMETIPRDLAKLLLSLGYEAT